MNSELVRSDTDKMLFGVAGGLAQYFNVDATLVRLAFVILGLMTFGTAAVAYVVLMIIMHEGGFSGSSMGSADSFDPDEIVIND